MFFELVSILFAIVPDYGNEYMTKKKKLIQFKSFCTKTKFKPQHIYSFVEFQVFTEKKINCSWPHLVIVESFVEEQAHR